MEAEDPAALARLWDDGGREGFHAFLGGVEGAANRPFEAPSLAAKLSRRQWVRVPINPELNRQEHADERLYMEVLCIEANGESVGNLMSTQRLWDSRCLAKQSPFQEAPIGKF